MLLCTFPYANCDYLITLKPLLLYKASSDNVQSTSTESPPIVFVSPAKQKRDICIAFPAASLSAAAAAV